jgi:hypothetical protein
MTETADFEQQVFSVNEFCTRNRISLSTWWKLRREGRGPRTMQLGHVSRITRDAELDWRREMEAHASTAKAKLERQRRSDYARQLGKAAAKSPSHISARRRAASAKQRRGT